MRYGAQLDWLNFFLADVRGGLGPHARARALREWRVRPDAGYFAVRWNIDCNQASYAAGVSMSCT
jgi:hypothetical protein